MLKFRKVKNLLFLKEITKKIKNNIKQKLKQSIIQNFQINNNKKELIKIKNYKKKKICLTSGKNKTIQKKIKLERHVIHNLVTKNNIQNFKI